MGVIITNTLLGSKTFTTGQKLAIQLYIEPFYNQIKKTANLTVHVYDLKQGNVYHTQANELRTTHSTS